MFVMAAKAAIHGNAWPGRYQWSWMAASAAMAYEVLGAKW